MKKLKCYHTLRAPAVFLIIYYTASMRSHKSLILYPSKIGRLVCTAASILIEPEASKVLFSIDASLSPFQFGISIVIISFCTSSFYTPSFRPGAAFVTSFGTSFLGHVVGKLCYTREILVLGVWDGNHREMGARKVDGAQWARVLLRVRRRESMIVLARDSSPKDKTSGIIVEFFEGCIVSH